MKRFRAFRIAVSLAALFVCGLALADQLTGAGSTYWSMRTTLSAATTTCVKASSDGSSKCALFFAGEGSSPKARTVPMFMASTATTLCWSLNPTGDIDTTKGEIGTAKRGTCIPLPTSAPGWSERPLYSRLYNTGQFSYTGICNTKLAGTIATSWENGAAGDALVFAPCLADADCNTNHGTAATCVPYTTLKAPPVGTSADTLKLYREMLENVGVYALVEAAGTPTLDAAKQEIPERSSN